MWLIAAIGDAVGLAILVPTLLDPPASMPTWSEVLAAFERVDAAEGLSDKVTKQVNRGGDHAPVGTSELEGAQSLSRDRLESFTSDLLDELRAL